MISLTRKEYNREFIQKGYEEFTEDQFRKWIDLNSEVLVKGEQGMLEDDLEKAEYEEFKEEIRSFTAVEVVEPSPVSQFRIQKSIMYVRPKQVEWDEPEIIKGEDGEDIQKARSGRYKDTPLNRKLGRVGSPYGGKKGAEEKKEEEGKSDDMPNGFKMGDVVETKNETDIPISLRDVRGKIVGTVKGTTSVPLYLKVDTGTTVHEVNPNYFMKTSNSTDEGDDKGKSEKKDLIDERTKKQVKEVKEGKRKKEDIDLPF